MSDKTYNGWSNYETWNCALWLDNDQGTYEMFRERAQWLVNDAGSIDEADPKPLADDIESMMDEGCPETTGVYADLLRGAMGEIDYREIAEHMIADCEEPTQQVRDEDGAT